MPRFQVRPVVLARILGDISNPLSIGLGSDTLRLRPLDATRIGGDTGQRAYRNPAAPLMHDLTHVLPYSGA